METIIRRSRRTYNISRALEPTAPEGTLCFDIDSWKNIVGAAIQSGTPQTNQKVHTKPWQTEEIQSLIRQRREARTTDAKRHISKIIQKEIRKLARTYQSERAEEILKECAQLDRLNQIQREPVKQQRKDDLVDPERFADCLEEIYKSNKMLSPIDRRMLANIPPIDISEFQHALQKMKMGVVRTRHY